VNFPAFALNNKTIVIVIAVLLTLVGLNVFLTAPRKEDPQFNIRDAWIITIWPGATAKQVEDLVADPIEDAMAGVEAIRKIDTTSVPVVFEAPLASGLLGHFIAAISGGSLYRQQSFLLDSLGTQVFPDFVQIEELPFLKRGLASGPFDNEGVATHTRAIVKDGIVEGYLLGSYAARKLGMQSTGNAGGSHNLVLQSTGETFESLLKSD